MRVGRALLTWIVVFVALMLLLVVVAVLVGAGISSYELVLVLVASVVAAFVVIRGLRAGRPRGG